MTERLTADWNCQRAGFKYNVHTEIDLTNSRPQQVHRAAKTEKIFRVARPSFKIPEQLREGGPPWMPLPPPYRPHIPDSKITRWSDVTFTYHWRP